MRQEELNFGVAGVEEGLGYTVTIHAGSRRMSPGCRSFVYFDAPGVHVGVGGYPYRHRYYNYGGGRWNGCRPGWTVQGGVCKPYRYGPWDIYGGRQSDYWR